MSLPLRSAVPFWLLFLASIALVGACAGPGTGAEETPTTLDVHPTPPPHITAGEAAVPTTGEFRALVFFVRFRDDDTTSDCSLGLIEWPAHAALPQLADSLLSSDPTPPFPESSLTAFFHQQSLGRFTLYGDSYGYVTRHDEVDYRLRDTRNLDRNKLTRELLEHFDPLIDFSQYDANNDGFVDQVFVVMRNFQELFVFGNPSISGVSSLGYSALEEDALLDGMRLHATRSGSYNRYGRVDPLHDMVTLLAHEFGHDLFNGNRYFRNHLDPIEGNRVPYHPPPGEDHAYADRMTGYALMQGAGRATQRVWSLHLSAAERSYVNADDPDPASRWIDCPDPEHGASYALRDLYDFGDCFRLTFEDNPRVTELFVQHIDGHGPFNRHRLTPSIIDAPCPGCRMVEVGTPVTGLLVELSQRNAELPFNARRSVIPPDNALERQMGCELAIDVGPRLNETLGNDFWRPDNGRQITPWTRPNVFGYTFAEDVPAQYFETGWHVLDAVRYDYGVDQQRPALTFDYYRTPFDLETFVIREDSWMGAESEGLVFRGHVRVSEGATLTIEPGVDVRFSGGLSAEDGARIVRQ